MKFYFKYIEIPNYEAIIAQLRKYVLSLDLNGKYGWHTLDADVLLTECELLKTFFSDHSLNLRLSGVIITRPYSTNSIHLDHLGHDFSRLALNCNILNCETSKTRFYTATKSPVLKHNANKVPYCEYPADTIFSPVCEYTLDRPVLINTQEPHQVINKQNKIRISISFRFYEDPRL